MKLNEIVFIDSLPTLDLHGYDRDYAHIKINEFINDNYIMGNRNVVIVHGIGDGIIKSVTQDTLRRNKKVLDFKIFIANVGCTIVEIDRKQSIDNKIKR